jgi:hypothetical protein
MNAITLTVEEHSVYEIRPMGPSQTLQLFPLAVADILAEDMAEPQRACLVVDVPIHALHRPGLIPVSMRSDQ